MKKIKSLIISFIFVTVLLGAALFVLQTTAEQVQVQERGPAAVPLSTTPITNTSWRDFPENFTQGDGSSANPWIISTPGHLARMALNISGSSLSARIGHYRIVNDLDMGYRWWFHFGTASSNFRGRLYSVSGVEISNLRMYDHGGLITWASTGARFENIFITEAHIEIPTPTDEELRGTVLFGTGFLVGNIARHDDTYGDSSVGVTLRNITVDNTSRIIGGTNAGIVGNLHGEGARLRVYDVITNGVHINNDSPIHGAGGILGRISGRDTSVSITNARVYGDSRSENNAIAGTATSDTGGIGGIIGVVSSTAGMVNISITNSRVVGFIGSALSEDANANNISAGGFIGHVRGTHTDNRIDIVDSVFGGTVINGSAGGGVGLGGFVGRLEGAGVRELNVENSYVDFNAEIDSRSSLVRLGGVLGILVAGTEPAHSRAVINCLNVNMYGLIRGGSYAAGGIIGAVPRHLTTIEIGGSSASSRSNIIVADGHQMSGGFVGGIVGSITGNNSQITLDHMNVNGNFVGTGNGGTGGLIGRLAGEGQNEGHPHRITNIEVSGTISGGNSGGLIGDYSPVGADIIIGGAIGVGAPNNIFINDASITNNISANHGVGGIIGRVNTLSDGAADRFISIHNAYVTGTISNSFASSTVQEFDAGGVGGIIGQISPGEDTNTVNVNIRAADVSANVFATALNTVSAGGFIGHIRGHHARSNVLIQNSTHSGIVEGTSIPAGSTPANSVSTGVGGFIGRVADATGTVGGVSRVSTRNIRIIDSYMYSSSQVIGIGQARAGGVVGAITGGSANALVSTLEISGVTLRGTIESITHTGGLLGLMARSNTIVEVSDIASYALVSGNVTGGLVATFNHSGMRNATIENVEVNGNVTGTSATGGLIGQAIGSVTIGNSEINIDGARVRGNIRKNSGTAGGAGGVFGVVGPSQEIAINNIIVIGYVDGNEQTGGLIGHYLSATNSTTHINNVEIRGQITGRGTGTGMDPGGIIGTIAGATNGPVIYIGHNNNALASEFNPIGINILNAATGDPLTVRATASNRNAGGVTGAITGAGSSISIRSVNMQRQTVGGSVSGFAGGIIGNITARNSTINIGSAVVSCVFISNSRIESVATAGGQVGGVIGALNYDGAARNNELIINNIVIMGSVNLNPSANNSSLGGFIGQIGVTTSAGAFLGDTVSIMNSSIEPAQTGANILSIDTAGSGISNLGGAIGRIGTGTETTAGQTPTRINVENVSVEGGFFRTGMTASNTRAGRIAGQITGNWVYLDIGRVYTNYIDVPNTFVWQYTENQRATLPSAITSFIGWRPNVIGQNEIKILQAGAVVLSLAVGDVAVICRYHLSPPVSENEFIIPLPTGLPNTGQRTRFLGWSLTEGGEVAHQPGNNVVASYGEQVLLYAVWIYRIFIYRITSNNGLFYVHEVESATNHGIVYTLVVVGTSLQSVMNAIRDDSIGESVVIIFG